MFFSFLGVSKKRWGQGEREIMGQLIKTHLTGGSAISHRRILVEKKSLSSHTDVVLDVAYLALQQQAFSSRWI